MSTQSLDDKFRNNDQLVAAAFNSCLDLEKFAALPPYVRDRAIALFCHHRLKPVCFFHSLGFGLKVYNEALSSGVSFPGDEVDVPKGGKVKVDREGHWLRCGKALWEKAVEENDQPVKKKPNDPKYQIATDDLCSWLETTGLTLSELRRTDFDYGDMDVSWTTDRIDAIKYNKAAAERVLDLLNSNHDDEDTKYILVRVPQ